MKLTFTCTAQLDNYCSTGKNKEYVYFLLITKKKKNFRQQQYVLTQCSQKLFQKLSATFTFIVRKGYPVSIQIYLLS